MTDETLPDPDTPEQLSRRMYRGQSAGYWKRRLMLRGWPETEAHEWALFLVGEVREPPRKD